MSETAVFEKIYRDYLDQVSLLDLAGLGESLGVAPDGDGVAVPFFGQVHHVSGRGTTDSQGLRPSHAVSVILCKYLLMCPDIVLAGPDWVTYKDFRDAAPFASGFMNHAERPISKNFSGRLADLKQACAELNGLPADVGVASDLAVRFEALPKVPLLLLFNDRDDEFPAQCSLLFERCAEHYLDMECLAMIGLVLAERLKRMADSPDQYDNQEGDFLR